MTYIPTWTGFLYLAVVIDAFSRKVVGWSMGERMTADLVLAALNMALHTRKPGRPRLIVWEDLHIVQVVKQRVGRRLVSITRRLAYGCMRRAEEVMQQTQVELGCINTAYIERLNATLRTWIPALVRRTRMPSGARVVTFACVVTARGATWRISS